MSRAPEEWHDLQAARTEIARLKREREGLGRLVSRMDDTMTTVAEDLREAYAPSNYAREVSPIQASDPAWRLEELRRRVLDAIEYLRKRRMDL